MNETLRNNIKHKREKSAMYKHLAIHHEEEVGNPEAFTFEGTAITANTVDIQMNSSSEFRQPAVHLSRIQLSAELQQDTELILSKAIRLIQVRDRRGRSNIAKCYLYVCPGVCGNLKV